MRRSDFRLLLILLMLVTPAVNARDVLTISNGEKVDLRQHLAPGKLTLVDFYADWCGPCKSLAPRLDRLAESHADRLALRKVNVTNWGSPVASQYGISSIPHLKLYNEQGKIVSEGNAGAVMRTLERELGGTGASDSRPTRVGARSKSPLPAVLFVVAAAIAAILYFRRRQAPGPQPEVRSPLPLQGRTIPTTDLKVRWFVMIDGSLEGPFSIDELDDLRTRGLVADNAKVRRRGDSSWKSLGPVIDGTGNGS